VRARGGEAPIKGIIFDFGGVIHSFDFGMFFRNLDRRTDRTLGEMSSLVAGSGLPRRYELGEVSSREFYHGIANLCGLRATEEEFVRAFVAIFAPIEPTIGLISFPTRTSGTSSITSGPWTCSPCSTR
jgi:hypothetical protein